LKNRPTHSIKFEKKEEATNGISCLFQDNLVLLLSSLAFLYQHLPYTNRAMRINPASAAQALRTLKVAIALGPAAVQAAMRIDPVAMIVAWAEQQVYHTYWDVRGNHEENQELRDSINHWLNQRDMYMAELRQMLIDIRTTSGVATEALLHRMASRTQELQRIFRYIQQIQSMIDEHALNMSEFATGEHLFMLRKLADLHSCIIHGLGPEWTWQNYDALIDHDARLVQQDVSLHALLAGMANRNVAFQNVEIFFAYFASFFEFMHRHLSPLHVILAPGADAFINDSDDDE
jgi:hypothetical protein